MPESEPAKPGKSGGCGRIAVEGSSLSFTRLVAGLSPAGRLLRQLHRLGVEQIQLRSQRGQLPAAWWRQVPSGLAVAYADAKHEADQDAAPGARQEADKQGWGPRQDGLVVISADAIYSTENLETWLSAGCLGTLEPDELLHSEDAWSRAETLIWRGADKSLEHDGVVAYFVGRPLARIFSRVLVSTPVTPNQVTVASLLVGLAGAFAAALGTYWGFLVGAFLYWFGMVVDCVDGDLARVRIEGSRLGQWMDSVADDISTAAFTAGMGVGLARAGVELPWSWIGADASWWAWTGTAAGLAVLLAQLHVYRGLVRAGLPIDTAMYPWFFLGDRGVVRSEPGLGTYLGHAVRRDFSSAAYTILCLVGLAPVVGVACIVGGLVVFSLALVDAVVKFAGASIPSGAD